METIHKSKAEALRTSALANVMEQRRTRNKAVRERRAARGKSFPVSWPFHDYLEY